MLRIVYVILYPYKIFVYILGSASHIMCVMCNDGIFAIFMWCVTCFQSSHSHSSIRTDTLLQHILHTPHTTQPPYSAVKNKNKIKNIRFEKFQSFRLFCSFFCSFIQFCLHCKWFRLFRLAASVAFNLNVFAGKIYTNNCLFSLVYWMGLPLSCGIWNPWGNVCLGREKKQRISTLVPVSGSDNCPKHTIYFR